MTKVGARHSIRLTITNGKVCKATVTVMARPTGEFAGLYRGTFWTRTWKVRGC